MRFDWENIHSVVFLLLRITFQVPGLAAPVYRPEHYEVTKTAYLREEFDSADIPMSVKELTRPKYVRKGYPGFVIGCLIIETQAYRRVIEVPIRNALVRLN